MIKGFTSGIECHFTLMLLKLSSCQLKLIYVFVLVGTSYHDTILELYNHQMLFTSHGCYNIPWQDKSVML